MSEEEDYMSDDILKTCLENDVRPGLLHKRSQQHAIAIERKRIQTEAVNKLKNPKKGELERERREEGLKETISADNKGFAMLQKMGYKPGTAIGKTGSGRVEPVPLVVRSGRQGLGREEALKQIASQKQAIRARQSQEKSVDAASFRLRLSQQAADRQTLSDLRRSQRVCEQLDQQHEILAPEQNFFWPERQKEENKEEGESSQETTKDEEEEDEDEFTPGEQLEMLTVYLRMSYCYCVWCGTSFDDEADLRDACPGPTRDDH